MSSGKILELKNITAGYHGHTVLQDIDFSVFEEDFIGVIGANGSGKTTLLKVILGLVRPVTGSIRFFSEGQKQGSTKHKIGYLPQYTMFDPKFPIRVFDVVLSGLSANMGLLRHFSKEEKQRAEQVMERMGILQLKKKAIGELSGGQMQRVFLARSLVSSPRLLLLDEPNTFVDKGFEVNFFEILEELNREVAIILVSHDLGMIVSHVKTIACVNRNLYYHDTNEITQELLDNYNCPIDLITHGHLPHRVLKIHDHNNKACGDCLAGREKDD
jgi:zinc transport system ATP-binding protein